MRLVKLGIANINTVVGAFVDNTDELIVRAKEMTEARTTVGCFQEQVIGGYPAEDLVQWRTFVSQQWEQLERFAAATAEFGYPTVFTLGLTVENGGHLFNSAAVACAGRILGVVPKEKLPTYGVFYEQRTFSPGMPGKVSQLDGGTPFGDLIFRFPFGTLAVEVCEDIWSPDGPMRRRCYSGAELVVNSSASPWRAGVVGSRREIVATRAGDSQATVVYVSQVGGNDSLVFDGGGFVSQNGKLMAEFPRWREQVAFQVVDLDRTARLRHENTTWRMDCQDYLRGQPTVTRLDCRESGSPPNDGHKYPVPASRSFFLPSDSQPESPRRRYFSDLIEAMVMALDAKVKAMPKGPINIAISGGKDSVLTLCLAYLHASRRFAHLSDEARKEAIRKGVRCWSMPTRYNSEATKGISATLCRELGVGFKEVAIQEAFDREVEAAKEMLEPGEQLTDTALQNIQARIRGQRMWNVTNSNRGFWLQTSNMSEKAVGYTTIGGDMMGAYGLIANLPKTVVVEMLRFIAEEYGWQGVKDVLAVKASAELKEDQQDEDDLMPFPVLDALMYLFLGEKMSPVEVFRVVRQMWADAELKEMDRNYHPGKLVDWSLRFFRLFIRSVFKWVQCPESAHLGTLELDRERALQIPVVHSPQWHQIGSEMEGVEAEYQKGVREEAPTDEEPAGDDPEPSET